MHHSFSAASSHLLLLLLLLPLEPHLQYLIGSPLITTAAAASPNHTSRLVVAFQENLPPTPPSPAERHQSAVTPHQAPQHDSHRMRSAWHCHGRNQRELVQNLMEANIIKSPLVAQVMTLVDRRDYLPKLQSLYGGDARASLYPYVDAPQSIGHGQTISGEWQLCVCVCVCWNDRSSGVLVDSFVSRYRCLCMSHSHCRRPTTAPHMHAHVLEEMLPAMLPHSNEDSNVPVRILDVGCGSGYLTACLGRLVYKPAGTESSTSLLGRPGQVFGIDIYPELVARSKQNILASSADRELFESKTIQLRVGNGWEGWPEEAPYDAIHVGAAAEELPQSLAAQLKVGGVLIVPIGPHGHAQVLYKIERVKQHQADNARAFDPSDYRMKQLLGVQYVPLVREL